MTKVFYSPAYVVAAHSFDTTRKAKWVADSLEVEAIGGITLSAPSALTEDEVAIAHEREYVNAVKTGAPKGLATSQGFDWDPSLWTGVRASSGGVLVLSELFYPGWEARVNGRPETINEVDGGLRALLVPAGDSQVMVDYSPRSVMVGGVLSGLTFAFTLGVRPEPGLPSAPWLFPPMRRRPSTTIPT